MHHPEIDYLSAVNVLRSQAAALVFNAQDTYKLARKARRSIADLAAIERCGKGIREAIKHLDSLSMYVDPQQQSTSADTKK
jgi:hypothetical protein